MLSCTITKGRVTAYNTTRIVFNMSAPLNLMYSDVGPIFATLTVAGMTTGTPMQVCSHLDV